MQREHPSPPSPRRGTGARVGRILPRGHGWSQVALVLAAVASYELLRRFLPPDWPRALAHARALAAWERRWHIDWETPLQRVFLHLPGLVEAMNAFYLAGSFVLTGGFFLWLYRRTPAGFRVFRDAFLLATAVALVLEWRFPMAPPRLAGIGVEDTLRRLSGIDIGSPGVSGLTDPVAAMPSLHAGWAFGVGIGIAAYARSWWGRAAGLAYPLAVDLTVVVTGNHFVLDTLAGTAIVAASLGVASVTSGAQVVVSVPRRGVEQSGSSPGS